MTTKATPSNTEADGVGILRAVMDAVNDDAAEEHALAQPLAPTEDDHRWHEAMNTFVRTKLAELKRQHTPAVVPAPTAAAPIPPEIMALSRAEVVAQIETLRHKVNVQYAVLEVSQVTDNDLRRLLWTLSSPPLQE